MNPEKLLDEVATAIKHRTISTSFRWYLIYYYNRVTCVPSYVPVPPEIILDEFTEQQVQRGFTTKEWDQLSTKVTEFYKELHK